MNKSVLRKVYLEKRNFLTKTEYTHRNQALLEQFTDKIDLSRIEMVHVFLSIAKNKEVNTWPLVERCWALGKKVVVPKVVPGSNHLEHYLLENKNQLKTSKWGIPEPQTGQLVAVEALDLVLVPLIVFDRKGFRIGYGKGFYDRFLAQKKPGCKTVGLSLSTPLDNIPYSESHDIPLNACLTPYTQYVFG